MALFYVDASALVKLVRDEPESSALRAFLTDADLVSCELVLAEVPRAIRRAAARDPRLPLDLLVDRTADLLDAVALMPLDRWLLAAAGALDEPAPLRLEGDPYALSRALDAIHLTAAVHASPIDAFVTYDERQAAVARLAGLRTAAPA